jgi:glyoxylase-like metal-dependent hydrolase (beta-lactamase superfamily II)
VGDLFPTTAHLPLPWIMGYDLEPLRTLESKRTILDEAVGGGWRLIFEHDPRVAIATAVRDGKGVVLRDITAAPEPANVASG